MDRMLIISGPSGSGKSTLCKIIQDNIESVYFSISTTTRTPRKGEIDGKHYHFVSKENFVQDIQEGTFLEWAEVHGNYYGTSLVPIKKALQEHKLVIFDVDVQGHRSIKAKYHNAKSVFITTKNREILRQRLLSRQTNLKNDIELRLLYAYNEIEHIKHFDYLIINDNLEKSKKAILAIATSLEYICGNATYKLLSENWLAN